MPLNRLSSENCRASADDLVRTEEEIDFDLRVLVAVGAVDGIRFNQFRVLLCESFPQRHPLGLVAPITSRLRFTASSPSSA